MAEGGKAREEGDAGAGGGVAASAAGGSTGEPRPVAFRTFLPRCKAVVTQVLEAELEGEPFREGNEPTQANDLSAAIVKRLTKLGEAFKFVVVVHMHQKAPDPPHAFQGSASVAWDAATDGVCKVVWENDSILCYVSVFCVGL